MQRLQPHGSLHFTLDRARAGSAVAGEGGELGSHSPLQDSFDGCLGVVRGGHRRWGSRLLFCWCTCQKFQQPALLLLLQRTKWNMGGEQADQLPSFCFWKISARVAGNLPKLPRLEADPRRDWAFGNKDPTKIPPHPTGFQLVQRSKDLTYCKDYLSFQVHPGSDHVPFKRNSAVTVAQQRHKLPMQRKRQLSAALSLPGESWPPIEKLLKSNKLGPTAKNLLWEAQGSEERCQIPVCCKRSTCHPCLVYHLMQIYSRENGHKTWVQWFNSSFQNMLSIISCITHLYLFMSPSQKWVTYPCGLS